MGTEDGSAMGNGGQTYKRYTDRVVSGMSGDIKSLVIEKGVELIGVKSMGVEFTGVDPPEAMELQGQRGGDQ